MPLVKAGAEADRTASRRKKLLAVRALTSFGTLDRRPSRTYPLWEL